MRSAINKKLTYIITIAILLVVAIFIWSLIYKLQDDAYLKVAFLDIGQGDAIFIESPSGVQVLMDGGPSGPLVLRQLASVMPFYDRRIDMIMATHPDTDHIGGLTDVLKRYEVGRVVRPGVQHDASAIDSLLLEVAKEKSSRVVETLARRAQVYDLGEGKAGRVELHILFPDRNVSGLETNMASIVARLTYGETSVLLTGDSPIAIEEYLVNLDGSTSLTTGGNRLKSDILKLGHHGSKTSSSDAFLGFVNPQWAIISAGKDNKYGHPHKEVLDKLKRFAIPTLSTIDRGTIEFKSDGNQWQLVGK